MPRPEDHISAIPIRPSIAQLMGGSFAIAMLLVVVAFVLAVDHLFLASWMPEGTLFADGCNPSIEGDAGGFALVLLGVLLFSLLGLHLFFRESPVMTALGAMVFLVIQVWMISRYPSLVGFLEGPGILLHNWPARTCPDTLLREVFYARYNAVSGLAATPSGTSIGGGVQQSFTNMLQFNLFVAMVMAAVIWVVGLVSWLVRAVLKALKRPVPRGSLGLLGSAWLGIPERIILFQTSVLTASAVLFGPAMMLNRDDPGAIAATIENVIWAPALLFLLDVARWALTTASDALPKQKIVIETRETVHPFLQQVVDRLMRDFRQEVVLRADFEPETGHDRSKSFESVLPGESLIIEETLEARHFDLFADTIARQILDRGRTALVTCPDTAMDFVEDQLRSRLCDDKRASSRPRLYRVNQRGRRPDGVCDIVMASEYTIETLAAYIDNYRSELNLLGGMVMLNIHQMDFGLLDVALDRIKTEIPRPGELVGVFQSEPRNELANRVVNFNVTSGSTTQTVSTTDYERGLPQWLLVLDGSEHTNLGDNANSDDLPVCYRALIKIIPDFPRLKPFVYGHSDLYTQENWKIIQNRLLRREKDDLLKRLSSVEHEFLLPVQRSHAMAIVDDTQNLADALASTTSTPAAAETLKVVALGSYPAARFLAAELRKTLQGTRTAADRYKALDSYFSAFGSLSSKPRQGPRELATKVRMTFLAEARASAMASASGTAQAQALKKLSQERVASFLDNRGARALRQLRINVSRGGLQRLFHVAFRLLPADSVVSVRPVDASDRGDGAGKLRVKNFVLSGTPAQSNDVLPSLELQSDSDLRLSLRLPLADYGLSYADKSMVALGGRTFNILHVDVNNRIIKCDFERLRPQHPYLFVRDYALQYSAPNKQCYAVESYRQEPSTEQPFELITGYVDCAALTYHALKYGTPRKPFGSNDQFPERVSTTASSYAQMRSATMLRLVPVGAETESGSGPTGRRHRGGRRAASMAGSRRGGRQDAISPQVAFTLAMTLQDILAMQFPTHAHRISVLCPQASNALASLGTEPLEQFVAHRLRHLTDLGEDGIPVARIQAAPTSAAVSRDFEAFSTAFSDQGRAAQGENSKAGQAILTLLMVEDSDHDLGVAQSFYDQYPRIFQLWCGLLAHCAANKDTPVETGYDFGSGHLSDLFDFDGAVQIVEALRETRR